LKAGKFIKNLKQIQIFKQALDTPWKVANEIWRWLEWPWIRLLFFNTGISLGNGWRIHGKPIIQKHRQSEIKFGDRINLRSSVRSNPLRPNHPVILCTWQANAVLEIGDDFGMTGGSIVAAEKITIGNRVVVGANTTLMDTDFHPLDPKLRHSLPKAAVTAPIIIEDDVFIGMNCLILKGVRIGQGAVISAASVVTRDVPPGSIAAGNPAKVIGQVKI